MAAEDTTITPLLVGLEKEIFEYLKTRGIIKKLEKGLKFQKSKLADLQKNPLVMNIIGNLDKLEKKSKIRSEEKKKPPVLQKSPYLSSSSSETPSSVAKRPRKEFPDMTEERNKILREEKERQYIKES